MKKSIVKTLIGILVGLFICGAVGYILSGRASAVDKTPPHVLPVTKHDKCIDHKEFIRAVRADQTRLEKSMGVYGDGYQIYSKEHAKYTIVRYFWCGHKLDDGYYQISYSRNKAGLYMAGYISEWRFGQYAKRAV